MDKKVALHMAFCAGIIGVCGIFLFYGMGTLVVAVVVGAAIVLLLNILLRGMGFLINRKLGKAVFLKRISSILFAVLTVVVSVCVLVYAVQDSMMFYNVHDPESRELLQDREGYHEVHFTAANGKTYHGMMYRASDEIAPLVIYFGGNGEVSYRNLRNRDEQNQWRHFAGYHYLFIDYEGYGLNGGSPHYRNMYEQTLEVFDYAVALPYVDSGHIVAMGYSLGTGSAVYLAANRPVAGLILATPYANGTDLYNGMLPIFHGPMKLLVRQKLPSDEYAPSVACPVLIIASRRDEAIPFSSSERLASLFNGDVEFIKLETALHNTIFQAEGVFDRVLKFLEGVAAQ